MEHETPLAVDVIVADAAFAKPATVLRP